MSVSKPKVEKEVTEELIRLRLKIWKTRSRFSRSVGVSLLIISAIFLFLAYITRYIVFEVSSILALFLGVVFVLSEVEPHIKLRIANRAMLSPLSTLCCLLNYFDLPGKGIFIPSIEGDSVKLFIPRKENDNIPILDHSDNVKVVSKAGLTLPPIGSDLLKLYEEEIGDIGDFDWNYLVEWLPRIVVEEFKLADKLEIITNEDEIQCRLTNLSLNGLCKSEEVKQVCRSTGCPVISSMAEAIAKNTRRIVHYVGCAYEPSTRITEANYRFGPSIENE